MFDFQFDFFGIGGTGQLIFDGLARGMLYGLLALGIVLIYRSTKVINFAVGNMGIPASLLLGLMVINWDIPFWISLLAALAFGVLIGAIVDVLIVRRLFTAPRVILLVATIGVAQLCQAAVVLLPSVEREAGTRFPALITKNFEQTKDGEASTWSSSIADLLGLRLRGSQVAIILIVPLLAAGLGAFLNRTTFGQTVQASADNANLARLSGISPRKVSLFVWSVAGFLAAVTAILLSGDDGGTTGFLNLGPSTMVRALAAAVLAGMVSFPRALGAGMLIGAGEAMVRFNFLRQTGLTDFLILVAVIIAVSFLGRRERGEVARYSFVPKSRPVPEHLKQMWIVRNLPRLLSFIGLGMLAMIPLIASKPSQQLLFSEVIILAICGVSVVIVTGWSGQLALGQMAFAGLGALTVGAITQGRDLGVGIGSWDSGYLIAGVPIRGHFFTLPVPDLPFVVAILIATVVVAAIAALVGLTSLRVQGLLLAITTFAFGLAAERFLFQRNFFNGGDTLQTPVDRGDITFEIFGDELRGWFLDSQQSYFYFCLAGLALVVGIVAHLRRSGIGRTAIAVRDNAESASGYTVSPRRLRLMTFALAGGVAAFGGAMLGGLLQKVALTEQGFQNVDSLRVVAIAVIGGLGSVVGPVLGSLWAVGLPSVPWWEDNDAVPFLTSGIGLLVLLLYIPGGFMQLAYGGRDAFFRFLEGRMPAPDTSSDKAPPAALTRSSQRSDIDVPLEVNNVSVSFGGNRAVADVSMEMRSGEVVGLIGTNGAGKSTLMNAIGGYLPSEGTVEILGQDVSGMPAHQRSKLGLGRTFQAATLFPELTVRETVMVALESRGRTGFVSTVLHLPKASRSERSKRAEASELISFLGLGRYADAYISDLSTGTRRIVELAGLIALDAEVLCLDEPTAGVAQRETEAFGPLLLEIRRELDASVLVIEHDMPLIMSISDRVYCLEAGQVIAEGFPDAVRNDPRVIASYLGTDERAIDRSDS